MDLEESRPPSNLIDHIVVNPPPVKAPHPSRLAAVIALLALLTTGLALFPLFVSLRLAREADLLLDEARRGAPGSDELATVVAAAERAARARPADQQRWRRLAQAYTLSGQPAAAVGALEQAYRLQPDSLLIRQELASAYGVVGSLEQAQAILRSIGHDPATLIQQGNAFMGNEQYADALRAYELAEQNGQELSPEAVVSRAFAAIFSGDPGAEQLMNAARVGMPDLIPVEVSGVAQLSGAELRWLMVVPEMVSYGVPLAVTGGDGEQTGALWWSGHAGALVDVRTPGSYTITLVARNDVPAPISLRLGVNGRPRLEYDLVRADGSWEEVSFVADLPPGLAVINVWFLNDNAASGQDRNLVIRSLTLERLRDQR